MAMNLTFTSSSRASDVNSLKNDDVHFITLKQYAFVLSERTPILNIFCFVIDTLDLAINITYKTENCNIFKHFLLYLFVHISDL